jgi:hypothetical protein
VEHCANCEGHSTTTKHVPGQYDKAFATLSSAIQDAIGNTFPVEIVSNPNFRPRVGAFEVELIFAAKVHHITPLPSDIHLSEPSTSNERCNRRRQLHSTAT